jgi:hypothetical protein
MKKPPGNYAERPALARFPRVVRFYIILSKLKPEAIATSVTIYFKWVPPQRGALGGHVLRRQGSPDTG